MLKTTLIQKLSLTQSGLQCIAHIFNGHESLAYSVAIAHDNSFIVTGSGDKTAKIWKLDELDALVVPQVLLLLKYATADHKIDIEKESETL